MATSVYSSNGAQTFPSLVGVGSVYFSLPMKRMVALVSFLLLTVVSSAVPAKPGLTRTLTLTDGSTVDATLVGDEYLHYWLGEDGKAYQAVSQQKRGAKAGSEEGDAVYQTFDVEAAKKSAYERRNGANQRRARRLTPRKVGNVGNISGQKKGLIILVNFSDVAFQTGNDKALYQRIANKVGFSEGNFKGSMYDYFYAQSEGQFQLTFDVVGPVTVSKAQEYYGGNDTGGSDMHPAEMVIEALLLADSEVNYADYDWNTLCLPYISTLSVAQLISVYQKKKPNDEIRRIVRELRHRFNVRGRRMPVALVYLSDDNQ